MPKAVDPNQKRAELVTASWDVIATEGLRGATLRRVARQAGCTTGALTHYFPDRQALLVAALRAAQFEAGARMVEAARGASTDRERLRTVLLESLPLDEVRLREWRVWLAFWAESMHDPSLAAENARRYAEWREMLTEVIGPLTASAVQRDAEVDHVLALVDGLGLRLARSTEGGAARDAERRACEEALMRQLGRLGTA